MRYSPENTRVAVVGGGNIGTQFACVFASKGYQVNLMSSRPDAYEGTLEVIDEQGGLTVGRLNKVGSSFDEVLEGCRMIIVTHPAFMLGETARWILPHIKEGVLIGVIPGTGGAEFAFGECVKAGATLFGLQRVPSVARLETYGRRVRCEGLRSELFLASMPCADAEDIATMMSMVWGIPCHVLPNYLSITLTPSNPILHTTRLRCLFSDYGEGKVYDRNPLFYGEWDDESSGLLLECDDELQGMLSLMDGMDLGGVRSLRTHYESDTPAALTRKIRSIKSLHGLRSPMRRAGDGWVPDFGSRYFMADFPYGLAIIEALADLLHCGVEGIRDTMRWYRGVTGGDARFDLAEYGIETLEDLYRLY